MIAVQFAVVLLAILLGARLGGIAIGFAGSQGHAELRAVLDAVRTGDPAAAEAALRAHIARTRSMMTEIAASTGGDPR